ncbi:MAG TPA: nucleotidyl transferase AbiEii/AbiGii toxin family protein [Candidatus Nanoarchaeia archaeon]|nr:nucleotidyl transferase AbiEii/AbiGii toxin family protein [Candidatus Nanoarchaeia archaeon]
MISQKIPLALRIKKAQHKEIAEAQDIVVEELYRIFSKAVFHGGTSIWRCYNGNRFSEDIDVYIPKDLKKLDAFFKNLESIGFIVEKRKITENSLFSNLKINRITVRFEALFKDTKGILKEYENINGNLTTIYTLSPEELVKEKIGAYLNRLKVRDLYDIFFLLRYVINKEAIKEELKKLIKNFKEPVDKTELRVLIIEGLIPDVKEMLDYIKSWT